jgi:hypothetical protein
MAYSNIDKPSKYFNTITWTGDSTTPKTITGVGFQPDLIWGKDRSQSYSHQLFDAVRGFGSEKELTANATLIEGGQNADTYGYLSGVTADGFTTVKGTDPAGYDYWNESPDNYVAWNWLGANSTVSNTSGSITSTVSANTTSGFSIVTWVDSASTYTVGHGLGVAPKFIILKDRGTTYNWDVGCDSIGWANRLILNSTSASGAGYWNSTAPTSSVFTYIGNGTSNMVAYCFAEVKGFSKFGSYKGNGAVDGPFVYTGFKPAFVVIKRSDGTGNWIMFDNKRPNYNVIPFGLFPNSNNAEVNDVQYYGFDLLSNGFKIRNTVAYGGEYNEPNGNMIYMAFAENPFVSSKSIPTTAR